MNEKHDDGLEWLRQLRLKIAAECGNDVHAINECYRTAAARIPHEAYRDHSAKRGKRKVLTRG